MFKNAIYALAVFVSISLVHGASQSAKDNDSCGCLDMCDENYKDRSETGREAHANCRRGCESYGIKIRAEHPKPPVPYEAKRNAQDNCAFECMRRIPADKTQCDACIDGCLNGCDPGSTRLVRLTILLEKDTEAELDPVGLQQMLQDPALQQQLEETITKGKNSKVSIPASRYIKMPITKDEEKVQRGCTPEPHLCDSWLAGEPFLCAGLLVMAAGLLLAAYWRRGIPHDTSAQAPLLPEKVPLAPCV